MVLYYSGTGNSKFIAKCIASALETDCLNLNERIKTGDTSSVQTEENVILVTPTYAWRIPHIVSGWLGKAELVGAKRIWFVMDCGSEIGNAAKYNRQLAAQKHLRYMGTAQIIMPENYIAMFNAPQKEQARSIVEQAEPALQKALAQVRAGQEFSPLRDTRYDRFMSGPVNPAFYRFFVKADAFRATDACIGCGKCVELCPLNNIRLENGKPVWGKHCTHCMACICDCPKEAVEYIEKLNHQYIDLLNGDGLASDKFWGLNRRIREDRKSLGVQMELRKPDLPYTLVNLLHEKIITEDDLKQFSSELQDAVKQLQKRMEE